MCVEILRLNYLDSGPLLIVDCHQHWIITFLKQLIFLFGLTTGVGIKRSVRVGSCARTKTIIACWVRTTAVSDAVTWANCLASSSSSSSSTIFYKYQFTLGFSAVEPQHLMRCLFALAPVRPSSLPYCEPW